MYNQEEEKVESMIDIWARIYLSGRGMRPPAPSQKKKKKKKKTF